MHKPVKLACEEQIRIIPLANILPTRNVPAATLRTAKGKCIVASVTELGLIEPLMVYPQKDNAGFYILLDGHVRLTILRNLRKESCNCLVATDDEAYTYNHKVCRLSTMQEHFMILRAIENGVSEEQIAATLAVDVARIREKRNLLRGICPEAVMLLKDKRINAAAIRELRRVKPMRQIEMAEVMRSTHNFSESYAKCLVATSSEEQLIAGERPRELRGLTPDELSRMEHEMESLVKDFKVIQDSHGKNVLNLVVVIGYLKKLLDNARVVRYLSQHQPEILHQFQKIMDSRDLMENSGIAS